MAKRVGRVSAVLLVVISGCLTLGDEGLPQVWSDPFNTMPQPVTETQVSHTPASEAAGQRVGVMGQRILAMNPEIGIRPHFVAIGSDQPEIMHTGTEDLYITEGLARRCETDGQLAAVLSQEIAKMVVQREVLTMPSGRVSRRTPPPEMPVGRDSGGVFGSPDGTRRLELLQFEKNHSRDGDPVPPPPNPDLLARGYLEKTGFPASDLEAVAPLLRQADAHGTVYRQIQALRAGTPSPK